MTEDQTTQAILRFARGDSGATVVARTSALRDDLPVVGEGQVVETWNETATAIAREYRRLGREFTTADVREVVDVTPRQVRRVLAELAEAGYVRRVEEAEGRATTYERVDDPGAGEVDLPNRDEAVAPGREATKEYYTWNVRVRGGDAARTPAEPAGTPEVIGAPPAPDAVDGVEPPS
jgi:DNA-binding transcriptional ArsR family regulator